MGRTGEETLPGQGEGMRGGRAFVLPAGLDPSPLPLTILGPSCQAEAPTPHPSLESWYRKKSLAASLMAFSGVTRVRFTAAPVGHTGEHGQVGSPAGRLSASPGLPAGKGTTVTPWPPPPALSPTFVPGGGGHRRGQRQGLQALCTASRSSLVGLAEEPLSPGQKVLVLAERTPCAWPHLAWCG